MFWTRALTDDQVEEMIDLYQAGFDKVALGKYFGVSETTIHNWLLRRGIATRRQYCLIPAQELDTVDLYEAGVSTLAIGKHFGISPQTVANILQRRGASLRKAGGFRRLPLREDAFDVLTPESLCWLGIAATDGCVTGDKQAIDQVKLGLQFEDLDAVLGFRSFLGSEHAIDLSLEPHPTDPDKFVQMARFTVRSKRLVAALAKYGIVPQKTATLVAQGGVEVSKDFWRGSADGDGHLGIHASNQGPDACFKFDGISRPFVEQCLAFLEENGVRGDNHVGERDPAGSLGKQVKFTFKLGGNAALDAVALLYVDAPDGFVLPRKALAAAEMIVRGSRGELVGTIRESWKNDRAVAWAYDYLDRHPQREVRDDVLAQPPGSASDRAA